MLGGAEAPIYTFAGGSDAAGGGPGLTLYKGVLYGASGTGGGTGCGGTGCGTIYAGTPSDTETVLYRFQGGTDGALLNGRLIVWDGGLYGVTASGGAGTKCGTGGCGTVFRFTP